MIKAFFLFFLSSFSIISTLPASTPNRLARTVYVPNQAEISKMELSLVKLINEIRIQHGLKPLISSRLLTAAAQLHSTNMATGVVGFGHEGFEQRAHDIRRHGVHLSFAENVAFSHHVEKPLEAAVQGWMKSAGHRQNILGDFNETGIGIVFDVQGKCYITQLFAKKI